MTSEIPDYIFKKEVEYKAHQAPVPYSEVEIWIELDNPLPPHSPAITIMDFLRGAWYEAQRTFPGKTYGFEIPLDLFKLVQLSIGHTRPFYSQEKGQEPTLFGCPVVVVP